MCQLACDFCHTIYIRKDSIGHVDVLSCMIAHNAQSQPDDCMITSRMNMDAEVSQLFHDSTSNLLVTFSSINNTIQNVSARRQVIFPSCAIDLVLHNYWLKNSTVLWTEGSRGSLQITHKSSRNGNNDSYHQFLCVLAEWRPGTHIRAMWTSGQKQRCNVSFALGLHLSCPKTRIHIGYAGSMNNQYFLIVVDVFGSGRNNSNDSSIYPLQEPHFVLFSLSSIFPGILSRITVGNLVKKTVSSQHGHRITWHAKGRGRLRLNLVF